MSSDDPFLTAAAGIGRRLSSEAVWDRGCCDWVGATVDGRRPWRVEYRALGPSAYDGTAGVGLFLARLAAITGAPEARRTAVGALRHAIAHAPTLAPAGRDGLQGGLVGIVLAAARSAGLLGEPEMRDRACALVRDARLPSGPARCPDVIGGSAGAIAGMLALGELLDEPALVQQAVRVGHALLDRASVTRHGWSWGLPGHRFPHHLCGFSHGAAGIGWALKALSAATGDPRFRDGADGAFAYVESWRETRNGTWPDLRLPGQRRGSLHPGPTDATGSWCHGEAGIALALLGSDDATIPLRTTRRHLAGRMLEPVDDLSLCHGVGGAADVLLTAGPSVAAETLGHTAVDRYAYGPDPWPCGVPGAEPPGLFLGLSGIGWWLLRLSDARIPSPLGTWG